MIKILLAETNIALIVLAVIAGIVGLGFLLIFLSFIKIWIQAFFSGARVSFLDLIGMSLRKVPCRHIVGAYIKAVKAGITDIDTQQLERVFLVGGDFFPRKDRPELMEAESHDQWREEKIERAKRFWQRYPKEGDVMTCVNALIVARKAGLPITFDQLQEHHFAGGYIMDLVEAMVAATRADIKALDFELARAIDLAGRDLLKAVDTTVKPKVIDCPIVLPMIRERESATGRERYEGGPTMLDAVAKDGIRLLVRARVTVRAEIRQLIRGASGETIVARVGEGIVSAIGSSETYKDVLENPDRISETVLGRGLDAETAFEIVSIDIADVSVAAVGKVANVGAELDKLRAEADKEMRQAEAEGRAAMARALEQEMKAEVVRNEAKVPLAMAEAFKKGNLGVMDYYRMKNVMADTSMRDSIAKPKKKE